MGEDPTRDSALSNRLDATYDALMATTSRHFGLARPGYHLSGVAGLDTPTMNRVVLQDASIHDVARLIEDGHDFFGERRVPWSVVLASTRDPAWHSQLLARGLTYSSALEVLAREPVPLAPASSSDDAVSVREADRDDLALFTELLLEVFHMPRRFYPALADMSAAWRDLGGKLYLADVDGETMGTALLVEVDGVAGIYNVGTRRAARRRGVARALMERAFLDAAGADAVTLQVTPGSIAEGFYARLGFERVHSWRYYVPGVRLGSLATRWNESPG